MSGAVSLAIAGTARAAAMATAAIPRRRFSTTNALMSLASESRRKVVLDRELDPDVVRRKPVLVLALAPLELRSEHHVLDGVEHDVRERVLADLKRLAALRVRRVDVEARIADRRRHLVAPVRVHERNQAEEWQRLAVERVRRIAGKLRTDVGRRI